MIDTNIKEIVYGKNDKKKIVSVEVSDTHLELFVQDPKTGRVNSEIHNNKHWLLA